MVIFTVALDKKVRKGGKRSLCRTIMERLSFIAGC